MYIVKVIIPAFLKFLSIKYRVNFAIKTHNYRFSY